MIFAPATDFERALDGVGLAYERADLSLLGVRVQFTTPRDAWAAAQALRASLDVSRVHFAEGRYVIFVKSPEKRS